VFGVAGLGLAGRFGESAWVSFRLLIKDGWSHGRITRT